MPHTSKFSAVVEVLRSSPLVTQEGGCLEVTADWGIDADGDTITVAAFLSLSRAMGRRFGTIIAESPEPADSGFWQRFLATAAIDLRECGCLILVCQSWEIPPEIEALTKRYFSFALPLTYADGRLLVGNGVAGERLLFLRGPLPDFPGISQVETLSYRHLLNGDIDRAWQILREGGLMRASGYASLRYWNKLVLDRREAIAGKPVNSAGSSAVLGLWDLRFVPHALGEFLEFMAVLQCVAAELEIERISVWCLAPGDAQVRFDQHSLDKTIREARLQQFEQLMDFLPQGSAGFRLFEDPDAFDAALVEVMANHTVVPRYASESGGMFASYFHNYRFLSTAYARTNRPPYLRPSAGCLDDRSAASCQVSGGIGQAKGNRDAHEIQCA